MGSTHLRRSRRALAATAMLGMVGGSLVATSAANAAVMVSGSTIDPSGNYVEGSVTVYTESGSYVDTYYAEGGAFDIPLPDGAYKLQFYPSPEFATEWYRDKPDEASADVVTVAGAAQTLPAWTIDRAPSVGGVVRTVDGRGVRNARVEAYDAATGTLVGADSTDRAGLFRIGASVPVKLVFEGYDPDTGDTLATEWFNDKPSQATADPVAPTAAGADVGVVTLAPGGTIGGRITNEAGAPLHRAQACTDGSCDWTDANGVYLIEGVDTGQHEVTFVDPIGEYVGESWNNVPFDSPLDPTLVTVGPGQAVTGIDAALAAATTAAPNGVDVSGIVRDELGGLGVGYRIDLYDTPADPRDAKAVASTYSNRAGQYHFAQLDRIGGETEFKIMVQGEGPREDGDFSRRTTWSGNALGYDTAAVLTAAPRTMDFTLPVAGGVSGAVTSEAGGVLDSPSVSFRDAEQNYAGYAQDIALNGTFDERTLWPGTYTVQFGAADHVPEWWKDALPEHATTITVRPGQVVTGISAALTKDVKAVERPEIEGQAWVGKPLRLDVGRWNTQARSKFSYEWLVGSTVVATGPTLELRKSHLGKKVTGRVTNDAGFALGQALTTATAKVGYQPKLKAKVSRKAAAMTLKVKPLKAKKVKASVVVYEVAGTRANGEPKLKKLGKGKIAKGKGVVRFKKPLRAGKHKLVFRISGAGKVGSGDLTQKVKIKR
ncbi:hypothetical protein [Nocardioides sp. SYSU D00065]|uniref:hypothetical protein n=1 Tax=Nocardioides sp. SYSU D00065 TaxID=2817378 RepID=UPI001B33E99E|nr:hypothetical protein [Nocardioides sp. SYSU D00065]